MFSPAVAASGVCRSVQMLHRPGSFGGRASDNQDELQPSVYCILMSSSIFIAALPNALLMKMRL